MMFSRVTKLVLDRLMAAILLVVLSPLLIVIAIAIYLCIGHPILFIQARPGKNHRVFNFYKFRTMTNECDADGNLLPDGARLTPFGQFLRKSSLDELPQLWNVLKGDMSFVGPRPLLIAYLTRYTLEQAHRHDVQPGITGWAQVNGRNSISWEEKFKLDLWYVEHWSLWLDLKILALTVWKVMRRKDINQQGQATIEEFKGSKSYS